jgi:hypothetical protein
LPITAPDQRSFTCGKPFSSIFFRRVFFLPLAKYPADMPRTAEQDEWQEMQQTRHCQVKPLVSYSKIIQSHWKEREMS